MAVTDFSRIRGKGLQNRVILFNRRMADVYKKTNIKNKNLD